MHVFPVLEWGGLHFDLSTIIPIVVSFIIVLILAMASVSKLSVENPSKLQNFMEWVVEFVHKTIAGTMPLKQARMFISLGMTLMLFIFVSNLLGLPFGIVTDHSTELRFGDAVVISQQLIEAEGGHAHVAWWKSPTADASVTAGLALVVFFIIHVMGIKMNTKHYFKHYLEPFPIFLPLNLLKVVTKPFTLALRLYANIFAGEILIGVILMLSWASIPFLAVWQGFSIFIGAIQAFLFTILTMVYISESIVHNESH